MWSRCDPIDRAAARPGDLVFFVRTYDTSGMSHIGIVTKAGGGEMISAHVPGVGSNVIAGFWDDHLAAFGRLRGFPE